VLSRNENLNKTGEILESTPKQKSYLTMPPIEDTLGGEQGEGVVAQREPEQQDKTRFLREYTKTEELLSNAPDRRHALW
jgi:hypothetical protein